MADLTSSLVACQIRCGGPEETGACEQGVAAVGGLLTLRMTPIGSLLHPLLTSLRTSACSRASKLFNLTSLGTALRGTGSFAVSKPLETPSLTVPAVARTSPGRSVDVARVTL
ncbi:hypothetical protein AK812_SmicGene27609 [Symbiodinium microadriaticum]|uniref:Uncharacterized protein n=1 Tax=Symbiodinium microadriaticum TaxID=2951 RepID=A0A1Q9D6H1_SYMMI|nr:hypothetical protein AK812_SmicGene27609 [Symbiodinium microadriaticum]